MIPPVESVADHDVLPSEIKPGLTELVNQQIAPLQDKIEGLLTSADSLFAGGQQCDELRNAKQHQSHLGRTGCFGKQHQCTFF